MEKFGNLYPKSLEILLCGSVVMRQDLCFLYWAWPPELSQRLLNKADPDHGYTYDTCCYFLRLKKEQHWWERKVCLKSWVEPEKLTQKRLQMATAWLIVWPMDPPADLWRSWRPGFVWGGEWRTFKMFLWLPYRQTYPQTQRLAFIINTLHQLCHRFNLQYVYYIHYFFTTLSL